MPLSCAWLTTGTPSDTILTPEQLSDEHQLIARTAAEFVANEVVPAVPRLEQKDWAVARQLIERAGSLGLLGADVPEAFGGVGLDKLAAIVVGDAIGANAAFATTFGAQTGLAIIPLLCFGTPVQQQKYLPRLVSGEIIGAYCLSESGSGSDALGARARATRLADGSWSISGEKLWITNGGFADLFVVFAKVDGEQFSAFLVERGFAGVSSGKEEHKMGLHGSSTTPVLLQDARVPAENLLGEIGRGHKIAFNVLNYGRFKLAAMCTGGAKAALGEAARYAIGRRQFGQSIATFGAIRHKLAEMTVRLYAVESMMYRTTGLIDAAIGDQKDDPTAVASALEEFAVEASLLKVAGSEMIDFVVDESVQIHGGNGFVRDYPAEGRYRDARVNRIFEGTNEINRLLIPGLIVKRLKGGWSLRAYGLGSPTAAVEAMKMTALAALDIAIQTYGKSLANEQEVVMLLSDMVIEAFSAESTLLRAESAERGGHPAAGVHLAIAQVAVQDAGVRVATAARTAVSAMLSGPALTTTLADLERTWTAPTNTIAARRIIADAVTARAGYPFGVKST